MRLERNSVSRREFILVLILLGVMACAEGPPPRSERDYPPWNFEETLRQPGHHSLYLADGQIIGIYWGSDSTRLFIDGEEIPHLYTQGTYFLSAGAHDLELRSRDGTAISVRLRYYRRNP